MSIELVVVVNICNGIMFLVCNFTISGRLAIYGYIHNIPFTFGLSNHKEEIGHLSNFSSNNMNVPS